MLELYQKEVLNMNKTRKLLGFGLTLAAVVALAACSSSSSNTQSSASSSSQAAETSSSSSEAASKTGKYAIGDKITFDKQAEITITGVEWSDERNQFDDTNPDKVLKVTYNITNLSDKDIYVGSDLDLYVGGKKMESYPNDNTMESVSPNRSLEGATSHFGVKGTGDMELEVKPFAAFGEKPAIVAFTLQ